MSWIVRDLWQTLEARKQEYRALLEEERMEGFAVINRIASEVGRRWGVFLQLNFPPGSKKPGSSGLGHRDLTMLVYRDRKRFNPVSQDEVKRAFTPLNPLTYSSAGFGYEGFTARLSNGRIDCLPGGVHLWCDITSEILQVLDWLFTNAYGLKPP